MIISQPAWMIPGAIRHGSTNYVLLPDGRYIDRLTPVLVECTGTRIVEARNPDGTDAYVWQHDGDTCPIHERGY